MVMGIQSWQSRSSLSYQASAFLQAKDMTDYGIIFIDELLLGKPVWHDSDFRKHFS